MTDDERRATANLVDYLLATRAPDPQREWAAFLVGYALGSGVVLLYFLMLGSP